MTRLNREKLASAALIVGVFVVWELACLLFGISEFVLPRPSQIVMVLIDRWPALMPHAVQTLYTTLVGFAFAGVDPETMGTGPIPAVRRLLERTGVDPVSLREHALAGHEIPWAVDAISG